MTFGSKYNLKKHGSIRLTLNNELLAYTTTYKYLGITMDSTLTFNKHITNTIKIGSHKAYLLNKIMQNLNVYTSISLYKTMILPYTEYGDVIIDAANDKQLNKLQKIQNHCLRICLQANPRTNLIEVHSRAKLNYLADRRYSHLLNIMFRRKSNPVYLDDRQIATRLHRGSLFKVEHPKNNTFTRSVQYRGSVAWNSLGVEEKSIGLVPCL